MDTIRVLSDAKNAESHSSPQVMPGSMRTILLAMQTGGVGIIEVGVPFSDPTADGPVNQGTNLVALQNGVDYATILGQVKEARSEDYTVPVPVMGESNMRHHEVFRANEFTQVITALSLHWGEEKAV
ncbi:hypothetical protein PISMIDRAFT_20103 [Pisolithus microcarpus 441]|uniref:tryptophan synthase n=1 Tax=Pisolithus microcarpus 441 TaxID=765257 RepID=A0A0C9Y9Q6_9AGAM|nr:hypothetical protein PISMIDRAFT_20103 [Pisolithus microcarpus 441]